MKIKICIEPGCKNSSTSKNYCRLHYLKNWKDIKEEEQRKAADRLNKYVEGICKKNPEKYADAVRRDIRSDKWSEDEAPAPAANKSGDVIEQVMEGFGFQDDESVDRLISRIKVEKDF